MASCIQDFGKLFNRKTKEQFFRGIFSSEEFLNQDLDSEIWNNKLTEVMEILSSVDNTGMQAFDFNKLKERLKQTLSLEFDKLPADSPWGTIEFVEKTNDFIDEVVNTLKNKYIVENKIDTNPVINGEPLYDFSKLSQLVYERDSFDRYLKSLINTGLFKTIFINIFNNSSTKYKYEKFVVTDAQLNKNIAFFKNELWDDLVEYYTKSKTKSKSENLWKLSDTSLYKFYESNDGQSGLVLNDEIFSIQELSGKSFYIEVMSFIKNEMSNLIATNGDDVIFEEDKITTSQAYIKSLVLSNFDSFLLDNHADKISVNLDGRNSFGLPVNEFMKYKLDLKWVNKKNFGDESASDIENHTTGLIKMISSVIPFYEKLKTKTRERWIPNFQGYTVGKDNIDAIGAMINDINPQMILTYNGVKKSLGELYIMLDSGNITFKEILNILINESVNKDNSLYDKLPVLISLREFLYGDEGLSDAITKWREQNIKFADLIINPEQALINHIRTSVKNIYFSTSTNELSGNAKSRSIDVLNLDSQVKYDFEKLVTNLIKNWKLNKIKASDFRTINSFDDFIEFLNHSEKGGLDISNKTKTSFLASEYGKKFTDPNYFKDSLFIEHLKKLFSHPTVYTSDEKMILLTTNEIVDMLRNEKVNDILRLIELFKTSHRDSNHNIPRMIKNFEGSSMPTMGISNLATLFSIAVNKTDNFFKRNPGFYKRTQILLDVVGKYSGKAAQDLNGDELFTLQFTRGFIESMITESEVSVLPWNFSDKPKIYNVVVDANKSIKISDTESKTLKQLNSSNLKDLMFDTQKDYYEKLIGAIYKDFSLLDPEFFKRAVKGLNKIKKIEEFFENLNQKAESLKISPKKYLSNLINEHFNSPGKPYIEFTLDLHYSIYDGKIKFNQLLKGYSQIYSDKNVYQLWINSRENALISNLQQSYVPFSQILVGLGITETSSKIKKIEEIFGPQTYELEEKTGNKLGIKLVVDGKLTEIAKRYLWIKNFVTSQYANTTVKDVFLHSFKGDIKPINFLDKNANIEEMFQNFLTEEDQRSIVFTKRMNVPGASIGVYGKGKEGIELNMKVAAMTDPSAETFNYTGNSHKQDTFDGGAPMSPIMNELLKGSLPGNNLQSSQKPLAESISFKSSVTLKFATFALSNEEIKNSEFADKSGYVMMKKMHNINIWSDNEFTNLFQLTNIAGQTTDIYIPEILPNYAIPYRGNYRLIDTVTYLGKNNYRINFKGSDKAFKEVSINTLFDLWEAFGGAYSASMVDDVITENEYSIELVASIIKKHAIYNPSLKLKDKMIGMLLPQSAVKKGVTNLNDEADVYVNNDKQLSYFNFDTSFFGVQLDPYHSTDESTTNEITQVMSAITEMNAVPVLYNKIYEGIGDIISRGLDKFQLDISQPDGLKNLITSFIEHLNKSSQINNARVIVNGITEDLEAIIPLDNKAIYKQFVSYVIAKINTDFIRRLFPGSSSVLRPSQGYIMIFEDQNEKKYLTPDLLKYYKLLERNNPEFKELARLLNSQEFPTERDRIIAKVNLVLNNAPEFKPKPIAIQSIRPLDFVQLSKDILDENKEIIYSKDSIIKLTSISDYFKFKNILKTLNDPELIINKIYSLPRDLKPEDPTFIQQGLDDEIERSLFDLEAVEFKYFIQSFEKSKDKSILFNNKKYKDFLQYLKTINSKLKTLDTESLYEESLIYSQLWVRRNMDLLAQNKIFKTYDSFQTENPFFDIFAINDGLFDNFTSRLDFEYLNFDNIIKYKHRRPENIHTNVFKNTFGVSDKSVFEILNYEFHTLTKPQLKKIPFDLILFNTLTDSQLNIVLGNRNYVSVNGKLYERKTLEETANYDKISLEEVALKIKEVGTKLEQVFTKTEDNGDVFRLTNYGEKMYKLPKNWEIYKKDNSEILVIKDEYNPTMLGISEETEKDFKNFMKSFNDYDSVYLKELGYKTYNKLLDPEDEFLKFMDTVDSTIFDRDLSNYIRFKKKAYLEFKDSIIPKDPLQTVDKNTLRDSYTEFRKSRAWKNITSNYFTILFNKRKNSFRKSTQSISARIPAQGMQSFMSMDTVGFIKGNANDVYVSHWQLWLQGSDYDIDKLYMMMYGFKNGIFQGWSPQFDLQRFEESKKIPLPKNKKYTLISSKNNTIKYKVEQPDKTFVEVEEVIELNNKDLFNIDEALLLNDKALELKGLPKKSSFFDKFVYVIQELNKKDYKYLYTEDVRLFKAIKKHEEFYSEAGFKNFILSNLIDVADNPKTRIAATSPISFGVYDDYKKSSNNYRLSLYDGFTMGLQQEQNAVGKAVIGVAATGLKNYFGLIKYFSDYFEKINAGVNINTTDNAFFMREYVINGKTYLARNISGLNLSKISLQKQNDTLRSQLLEQLKDIKDQQQLEQYIDELLVDSPDKDVALTISSILSLATDNAKELVLAKINAGVAFAGMHIFMIALGIDPKDITEFMTGSVGQLAKENIKGNIFKSSYKMSVSKEVNKLPNLFTDSETKAQAETFKQIYNDAQELTTLGQLFKANQGSKASQEELISLLNNLERVIILKGKSFENNLREKFGKDGEDMTFEQLVKYDKPYLTDEYIKDTIVEANKYGLTDDILNLSRYYDDFEYKSAATNYYNLIKGTINILDVLNNLPHFNNMFKSFVVGRSILVNNTNKLNFISKIDRVSKAIINNKELGEIENYNILKGLFIAGNKDNPPSLHKDFISLFNDYYDNRVILSFMQNLGKSIDLLGLLDYLGTNTIKLLKNDSQTIDYIDYTRDQLINMNMLNIDLGTQYGIAQFRYIMESYIIPKLKETHKSNGFLKNYTFSSYQSYNLKKQMSYYLDESNFKELEELERGISELFGKDFSKEYSQEEGKTIRPSFNVNILSDGSRLEPTKAIDLLTLYNLITNEGRFGGNRASNLFFKDLDNLTSISRKFLTFEKNLKSKFIDDLVSVLETNTEAQKIFLLKSFGSENILHPNKNIELFLGKNGDEGTEISLNRYYTHPMDVSDATLTSSGLKIGQQTADAAKDNNLEIKVKCN